MKPRHQTLTCIPTWLGLGPFILSLLKLGRTRARKTTNLILSLQLPKQRQTTAKQWFLTQLEKKAHAQPHRAMVSLHKLSLIRAKKTTNLILSLQMPKRRQMPSKLWYLKPTCLPTGLSLRPQSYLSKQLTIQARTSITHGTTVILFVLKRKTRLPDRCLR